MKDINTLLKDLEHNTFLIGRFIDLQQNELVKELLKENIAILNKLQNDQNSEGTSLSGIKTVQSETLAGLHMMKDMLDDIIYLVKHGKKDI